MLHFGCSQLQLVSHLGHENVAQSLGCSPSFFIPWWLLCFSSFHTLLKQGWSFSLSSCFLGVQAQNSKSCPHLSSAIGCCHLYFPIKIIRGRFPDAMCRASCANSFGGDLISIRIQTDTLSLSNQKPAGIKKGYPAGNGIVIFLYTVYCQSILQTTCLYSSDSCFKILTWGKMVQNRGGLRSN